MARKSQGLKIYINVAFNDIYAALEKHGLPLTIANVRAVSDYLETTANDAVRAALIDWKPPKPEENDD